MKLTVILSVLILSLGLGGASFAQNVVSGARNVPKGKPGGSTLRCVPGPSSIVGAPCGQGFRNVSVKVSCIMENIPSAGTTRQCMMDVGTGLKVESENTMSCGCPCPTLPIPKCDITN